MLRQIVKDEESLRKLVGREIRKKAAPQIETTKEEIDSALDNFLKESSIKVYPIFLHFDVMFVYRGFDVTMIISSCILTKEEMQEYINVFNDL